MSEPSLSRFGDTAGITNRPVMPRGGLGWDSNAVPRSRAVYAPQRQPFNLEVGTTWTQWGTFTPHPYFGEHDALRGAMMKVPQADLYDASPNPFPANGVDDQPNAAFHLLHLAPTTSAHPGNTIFVGPTPLMAYQSPPTFGQQTIPIEAVGL